MKKEHNQAPDEAMLTRWMDGELHAKELAEVESWAQDHPELIAQRDAVQVMRSEIRAKVPASVEPPYADFFNQRILRMIEDEAETSRARAAAPGAGWLAGKLGKWLALPATAAAMALCFYLGTQVSQLSETAAPVASIPANPTIYTPDGDIRANIFTSGNTGATVVVLEGLDNIPDDFDIVGGPASAGVGQTDTVMVSTAMIF
jgi:anti-sigma factor RsiW